MTGLLSIHVRPGHPDFLDLPWHLPLESWAGATTRLVEVPRGLSRHEVLFASYRSEVYALKELPAGAAEEEFDVLRALEEKHMPAVTAAGHARVRTGGDEDGDSSVLVTRFEENALPYRTLFMQPGLARYRERLLDAMASLLVRLHLAGVYWGDCSLSNTLFKRDAGELLAVLVDAETSELEETLSDGQRRQDLEIMEENVAGELADLAAIAELPPSLGVWDTGTVIRQRYERLWTEITREVPIRTEERYRIHERIRALNELGFTVGEMELIPAAEGNHLRMRTIVTDRDYQRHLLHSLTGLSAGDRQASLMLDEIRELRATLSREQDQSVPLSVAAFRWQTDRYDPAVARLAAASGPEFDAPEAYCEVLEHKWYMSERAGADVGLGSAIDDYLARIPPGPALPA